MRQLKMKKLSAVIIALVLIAAIIFLWRRSSYEFTDNAYIQGDVTAIAPRVSGYVVEVLTDDNAAVSKGEILFRIDDRDYRARLLRAEALVKGAEATAVDAEASIRLQAQTILEAEAALVAAQAEYRQKDRITCGRKSYSKAKP